MNEINKRTPLRDFSIAEFFAEVYKNVGAGLGVTGITAWMISCTKFVYLVCNLPMMLICSAICVGAIHYLNRNMVTMTLSQGRIWYCGIAILEGILLSPFIIIYTSASILTIFCMTSVIFLVASQYGATTGEDLTKAHMLARTVMIGVGVVLVAQLALYAVGILGIHTVANIHWVMCIAIVILAPVCIAGTSQMLSEIYYRNPDAAEKMAIIGALQLFMQFLNLFVALLRLFGNKREE